MQNILKTDLPGCTEQNLSKIKKNEQPNLEQLSLFGCDLTGHLIFDPWRNTGWSQLKEISLCNFALEKPKNSQLGFKNICLYEFSKLQVLMLGIEGIILVNFQLNKMTMKSITKAKWTSLKKLNLSKKYITQCFVAKATKASILFANATGPEQSNSAQ